MFSAIKAYFGHLLEVPDAVSPARYRSLRRIMTILMVTVSVTPLLILTGINHAQYMSTLEREMENPLYAMVRKSQASMELFLGERASTVSLIAHAYSFDDLTNEQTLNRVFLALKSEFQGFVDMGLVDVNGRQVAYVGPYKLKDADYAGQPWLSEAQVKGRYISDVFLGLRGFPHMVIAVHRMEESGREWTLRVTIDTSRLERLVAAVGLMQDTDAFLCDSRGVLQTNSRFYGKVLDKLPLTLPPQSFETTVRPWKDDSGQDLMVAYTSLAGTDFMLLAVKPTLDIYKPWTALRSELLLVFCGGIAIIVLVTPILLPVSTAMGIDPIHFGMFMCLTLCLGGLTPPVGLCLITTSRIVDVDIDKMFPDLLWCIGIYVLVIFAADVCKYRRIKVRSVIEKQHWLCQVAVVALGVLTVLLLGVYGPGFEASNFIYSQF